MKVKIGGKIYNSDETPIMLILSECDKQDISLMQKGNNKYCKYPNKDTYTPTAIRLFMEADNEKKIHKEGLDLLEDINISCNRLFDKGKPICDIKMNKGTYEYLKSLGKVEINDNFIKKGNITNEFIWGIRIIINDSIQYLRVVPVEGKVHWL